MNDELSSPIPSEAAARNEENTVKFNLPIEDNRQNKDKNASQQVELLEEELKRQNVNTVLEQIHRFLGEYTSSFSQSPSISLVDGRAGEGTINGTTIELELPNMQQAINEMRVFIDPLLEKATEEDRNKIASQLAVALTASTALHEGVHILLDSRPGSKFASDLEVFTGAINEQGRTSTLLDEGIAYAIQSMHAPSIEPIGNLAPLPRKDDRLEVKQRKILGQKLKPIIQEYIGSNRHIDIEFFKKAKQLIIGIQKELRIDDRDIFVSFSPNLDPQAAIEGLAR